MQDQLPEEVWGREEYSDAPECSPQEAQPEVLAPQLALAREPVQDLAQVQGPEQVREREMVKDLEWELESDQLG